MRKEVLLPVLARLRGIVYELDAIAKMLELAGFEGDAWELRKVIGVLRAVADSRFDQIVIEVVRGD